MTLTTIPERPGVDEWHMHQSGAGDATSAINVRRCESLLCSSRNVRPHNFRKLCCSRRRQELMQVIFFLTTEEHIARSDASEV